MRHWFKDQDFRSLLKNTSYLAVSKAVAAVASLATLAFAGRGLGLAQFGVLILIASYAQAAGGLSKFQTWQVVIRYGGRVAETERQADFKTATGFALALDAVSGLVGMVAAIALLPLIGPWFGLEGKQVGYALIYCTLLPTMAAATPNGVIRALDRFDLISWQGTATPIARAILSGIGWWQSWSLPAYVAIWYLTDLGGDIYIWFLAWRELKRRDLLHGIRPTLRPRSLPGAWPFAIQVNLTSSLMSAWGPIARLIVGGLLGPASAALYRVAASLADSAQKPADLLGRAYYPQLVRMDLTTKHPWRLMRRAIAASGLFAGIGIALMLIGGKPLLEFAFGREFVPAYPALLIMLGVPLLTIVSFPLPSTLYALDRPDAPLKARGLATLAYFAIIVPLSHIAGLQGAAFAFLLANFLMVAVLAFYLRYEYRRVRAR
ncbi:MAG: oligosaccharide flippase family protein [Sphingomicrobium sp.]